MTSPQSSAPDSATRSSSDPASGTFETMTVRSFLDVLAAKQPTPGGGAAASVVASVAAALAGMVVNYSIGKKTLSAHQDALSASLVKLRRAADLFMRLADEDAAAYGTVNELSRLPEGDLRRAGLAAAQEASVQIPLAVMAGCVDLLILMKELAGITNRQLRSDLGIAAVVAEGGCRSSWWNVFINAGFLPDKAKGTTWLAEAGSMREKSVALARDVESACMT